MKFLRFLVFLLFFWAATTGNSSEATNTNMTANGVVATTKSLYLLFDANPEGTCTQLHVKIIAHKP